MNHTVSGSTDDTTAVRAGFEFDARRLDAWLRDRLDGYAGPTSVRQFQGGQSNPTYLLTTPSRRYVLRRKPPGDLLPSAHAIDREFRVLTALGTRTQVPVPRAHLLCSDPDVIGTPFFVMDYVEGRVFWDATLPQIPREDRPAYFEAMIDALAAVHTVDFEAAGLGDYGKPGSYFLRQINRWSRQYREDQHAGRVAAMERLIEWLPVNIPPGEEAAIVHGDFRIDNLIFDPASPRVLAILDWELSTIGHPLADFGYHLMMYRMPALAVTGFGDRDISQLNLPTEAQYVSEYCRRTGREYIPHLDFYLTFNFFRLAAIFHGIRGRLVRGTASGARARLYAECVEQVAELGWRQTRAE